MTVSAYCNLHGTELSFPTEYGSIPRVCSTGCPPVGVRAMVRLLRQRKRWDYGVARGAADPIRSGKAAGEFASGVPRKTCHDHP